MNSNALPPTPSAFSDLIGLIRIVNDPEAFEARIKQLQEAEQASRDAYATNAKALADANSAITELKEQHESVDKRIEHMNALQQKLDVDSGAASVAVKNARAMEEEAKQILASAKANAEAKENELSAREASVIDRERAAAILREKSEALIVEYDNKISQLSAITNVNKE